MLSLQSTVSRVARNVANCQRRQWKAQSKIYCRTFSSFVQEKNFSTKYKPVEATSYAEANLDLPISRLLRPKATRTEDVRQMLSLEGPRNKDWWTGVHPEDCAGFDISTKKLHSLPQINFARASCSKDSLRNYFNNTWCLTETLLSSLQGEEAFVRPPYHELRHPMIFYYGHPAAFYINKLRVAGLIATGINPFFEVIFETGVDEMSWDDLSKNKMDWPSVAEVHQYRQQVFNTVHSVIDNLSDAELSNINKESKVWSLLMAFEHERIHLETSSVLISELPVELVSAPQNFPGYFPSVNFVSTQSPAAGADYPVNNMISVPSTTVKLGRPETSPCFGWDNEYGYREFTLPEFNVSQYKVSNGEFLEFVKAGGYSQQEFWSTDGWKWRAFRNSKWPSHWVRKGPQGLHQFNLRVSFLFDAAVMNSANTYFAGSCYLTLLTCSGIGRS